MKKTIHPLAAFILLGLQATFGDIEVQNTSDGGAGSLRQAISDAVSGEIITFNGSLAGQTILSMSGRYLIDKNINIDASTIGGIIIDGNGLVTSNRIFEIEPNITNITNVFDSLTLTNGLATHAGGAILMHPGATLMLNNSTLSGNTANAYGGGIYNSHSTLTLNNTILTGNTAYYEGGGIYNELVLYLDTLTLNNTTLSGNTAGSGGGISHDGGTLILNNTTLSNNSATESGGGIYSDQGGRIMLNNATLSGNTAIAGGGIYNNQATVTLNNATLSGNTATGGGIYMAGRSGEGQLNSTNSIIAGNPAGNSSVRDNIYFSSPIPSFINSMFSGDPLLAPLGDYGGPTQTMQPLPGSPTIDAGGTTAHSIDQRGFSRVVGSSADMGAVEYQGLADLLFDSDGDGNPFGVEYALGTDWLTADRTNSANLSALAARGAAFGFNPNAANQTAWILKRSLDLVSDPFVEIYRYDGSTDTSTSNIPVSVNMTASGIEVQDLSGATNAYYQFEAEVSP